MADDYTTVTEVPGIKVTREQPRGMYTRYRFAADLCEGKEVLEVACGPGIGLGYLAKRTRKVIGGDYTQRLLRIAQSHYREAVALRLVPQTMKAKEIFKRIFFGELLTMKEEIEDGVVNYVSPVSISSNSPNFQYKVLYVVGRCR